jgi:hypothetical protein
MLDRPDAFNYLFKDSEYAPTAYKIARITHCNVSDIYTFYNSCGIQIGEVMGTNWDNNLAEIRSSFASDEVPMLELEDSLPCFDDGRDYFKMSDEFVNFGKIQDGIIISMLSKIGEKDG